MSKNTLRIRPKGITIALILLISLLTTFNPNNILVKAIQSENQDITYAEVAEDIIPLNFKPADQLKHPTKPLIYATDKENKQLYCINYETKEVDKMSFDLPPENMDFKDGNLYVSLLKQEHDDYMSDTDEKGAFAIIDTDQFQLKDIVDVDIDPWDIVIGNDDYIYITSGSSQWTKVCSYSKTTFEKKSEDIIRQQSYAKFHPNLNKLYTITTDSSPQDISIYSLQDGQFIEKYDSPYHGDYNMGNIFKISPDGKYIFTQSGNVFLASAGKRLDVKYTYSLKNNFNDIDFDLNNSCFYVATNDNRIIKYDYTNFEVIGEYVTERNIKNLFNDKDNLTVICENEEDNTTFIESISKSLIKQVITPPVEGIRLNGSISSVIFNSSKDKAYAVDKTFNKLLVLDTETKSVIKSLELPYKPLNLCLSDDESRLYIVNDDENYFVSEIDLNEFRNLRNLSYKSEINCEDYAKPHIYYSENKIYVVDGQWAPNLIMFDATTFENISSTSNINQVGDLCFSNDKKHLYYWKQYGWNAGNAGSDVYKYEISGDNLVKIDETGIGYPNFARDPLDTPIILLENQNSLICKNYIFNLNNLREIKRTFEEPIYAVNDSQTLAVGKKSAYSLIDDKRYELNLQLDPMKDDCILYVTDDNNLCYMKDNVIRFMKIEDKVPVASVTLNKHEATINAGETIQLTVTVNPDNATNKNVIWQSSNDEVIKVDTNGLIIGVKPGKATISVKTEDGLYTDSCELTVNEVTPVGKIDLKIISPQQDFEGFKAGQDAEVIIRVTNSSSENKKATLIIAIYDEHNKLINYATACKDIVSEESVDLTGVLKVSPNSYKVKCFVWDTIETMNPLGNVLEIPIIR